MSIKSLKKIQMSVTCAVHNLGVCEITHNIGHLSLLRFWCLSVYLYLKKSNNAVTSKHSTVPSVSAIIITMTIEHWNHSIEPFFGDNQTWKSTET